MKLVAALAVMMGLSTFTVPAQNGPGRGPGGPYGGGRMMMPVMRVLDTDTNGVLQASEITEAPKALQALDKNGDGKLNLDELHPRRPGGDGQAPPPGAPPAGRRMGGPPIIGALDANKDGELDANEISNAANALLTLDANKDGQLTREEIHPRGGPAGPRGPRGPQPPEGEQPPAQQ
ncbi:MAG TPA: hypothetical protein VN673_15955 [Clostridia bacterium]|nr:hypothetical protein [Clostridia bacterium]